MSNIEPERDWEAEFQAIAERLGVDLDEAPKSSGVNRHIVPTGSDAAEPDALPWATSGAIPPEESPRWRTGGRTPPSEVAPDDSASADERSPSSPVPGFRPEWRLADPHLQQGRTDHSHGAPGRGSPAHGSPEHDAAALDHIDDDDGFVEPDPKPLDVSDPSIVIMVAALALGPLWLVYLVFFHRDAPTLWWAAGAGVTVAGFILAVVRQPRSRDEDDPDDGARV